MARKEAQRVALLFGALDRLFRRAKGRDFTAEGGEAFILGGKPLRQIMVG